MFRIAVRFVAVAGFIAIGWAAGHAQAPAQATAVSQAPTPPDLAGTSDFELVVTSVHGETEVRCLRGCRLTWAPAKGKDGSVEMLAPDVKAAGTISPEGCLAPSWWQSNCRILGWKR